MQPADTETIFKDLFTREYEPLCRYAFTFMQETQLAEDIVQDTFIKVWERKRSMITEPNIRFYLITAVKNNCISTIRKQRTTPGHFSATDAENEAEMMVLPIEQREQESEQIQKIRDALNQLPPKCREVFLLVKMQGLSYKQAAEILELSVKTIENQMGKAIKMLRSFTNTFLLQLFFIKMWTCIGVLELIYVLTIRAID